jgi:tetratricopeptide (TPR) repeat protein
MPVQLFLSTVTDEFRSYRDELRRLLTRPNVVLRVQEDFIPTGTETLDKLDLYIAGCDAVIHLVGDMTGAWAVPPTLQALRARYPELAERLPPLKPSLDTNDPPLSYTQWEAYLAVYHRKPLVIAVPEPGTPRDAKYRVDADRQASQHAHLERLRALGRYAEITFGGADQLAAKLLRSSILDLLVKVGIVERIIALPYPSIGALFKGRDQLMADLHKSLARAADGSPASVVSNAVYGLGGIGKTRLAVEYAWRHADDYNALLFVVANTPDDLRRNLAALAGPEVLNLPEQSIADEQIRVAAVLRWLQQHPGWFLIIDNVDTEPAAAAVEDMLPKLHGGRVLITSRLARWSESVERLDVDVLPEDAAHAFLLERTAKARRKAVDDDAQARVLARELGCLALALEQAGAYINHHRLSFAQYLGQWHTNREKVSKWFDERVMKYSKGVAATWQTSVDQLGEPARRLIERLAWLAPEPIPESLLDVDVPDDADAAIDQRAALAELDTYSLVTRARDAATFTIHRLVQDVTRRSLMGEGRRAALMATLAWFDAAFTGDADDVRVRPTLEPLAPHVRAVTDRADAAEIFDWNPWLLIRLGDLLKSRVPLAEVEPIYRRALAKFQRLAKEEPNNASRQYSLGIGNERIGDILVAQGNLAGALKSYQAKQTIIGHLATSDPNNAGWQRDLSVSYEKVGNVLVAQGNLPEALKSFRDSHAIRERLAQVDPNNAGWQRDLSVSYEKVGDVLEAQGNLNKALKSFRDSHAIAERLAQADPNNAGWQRDLSVSYEKVGNVLVAQGNLPEALKSFRDSLAIIERLAKADPNNDGWQRDLSVSYHRAGDVLRLQGNLSGALQSFRDDLAIAERLAHADRNNAEWQRDLSISYSKIGSVLLAQGKAPEALKYFREDLAIAESLAKADPENAQWQVDVLVSHWRLATNGDDPARRWALIVAGLSMLKAANKLMAEQLRWLPEAERRLAEFEKS